MTMTKDIVLSLCQFTAQLPLLTSVSLIHAHKDEARARAVRTPQGQLIPGRRFESFFLCKYIFHHDGIEDRWLILMRTDIQASAPRMVVFLLLLLLITLAMAGFSKIHKHIHAYSGDFASCVEFLRFRPRAQDSLMCRVDGRSRQSKVDAAKDARARCGACDDVPTGFTTSSTRT